ncbi:formyltransferase family protein [Rhodoferax saidenbachensis]|uniref:Methionyl-tRNA formyltransferase n=1 Tax=Rhodoferax saidenbachensis TaxID=1484693 RepID=A0ABU1ZKG1_9BURK|nr:formyltransferase family protein [Rhodoferax saidenbachensis]MDR7306032.1 methionyl-tRNA formyltransferase [Rhodoferax saidenbachensis]
MKNFEKKEVNIGFLSTIDSPLLPLFLKEAIVHGVSNISVICDAKLRIEKDSQIWQERTAGELDFLWQECSDDISSSLSGVPFFFVKNHNDSSTLELIKKKNINCLINVGTPRRLSKSLLESVRHGVVNIHPGVLPLYRGCSAVEWALYNDERIGNTAHFMSEEYDAGPVIEFETYDFPRQVNYSKIRIHVYREGCRMAGRVLAKIQRDHLSPAAMQPQDESVARYWNPIPNEKMTLILEKLSTQSYRYQCL